MVPDLCAVLLLDFPSGFSRNQFQNAPGTSSIKPRLKLPSWCPALAKHVVEGNVLSSPSGCFKCCICKFEPCILWPGRRIPLVFNVIAESSFSGSSSIGSNLTFFGSRWIWMASNVDGKESPQDVFDHDLALWSRWGTRIGGNAFNKLPGAP